MQTDEEIQERRQLWMRYGTVMAVASFLFVAVIFVLFLLAPNLVVPVAIVGAVLLSLLGGLAARHVRRQDPLMRGR